MINSNKTYKLFLTKEFDLIRKNKIIEPNVSKYFGQIGSTLLEDIPYSSQLEIKLKAVKEAFNQILQLQPELENKWEIIESPSQFKYRFRMDFVCAFNPYEEPSNKFGQRQKKRFNKVVDMFECNLVSDIWFKKTRNVFDLLIESGIQCYDLVKNFGFLRYLVLREYENEAMLNIVTLSTQYTSNIHKAAQYALDNNFKSVNWIINETKTDMSEGLLHQTFGNDCITLNFELNNAKYKFKVGPQTFFQNNIQGFSLLISYILEILPNIKPTPILYDLFCGSGMVGICLSKSFSQVIGLELNRESIEYAVQNSRLNHVDNTKYINADLLKEFPTSIDQNQTIVVDPPRSGLQKAGIKLIQKLNPLNIIYISCNPVTQAQDVEELQKNYLIKSIKAFDLFPQTYHLENVVIFERKD